MAGHLAAREAVRAGAPYASPPTLCFLFLSAQRAGGRSLSPPRLLGSSGHPGACRVCTGPQGPARVSGVRRGVITRHPGPGGL